MGLNSAPTQGRKKKRMGAAPSSNVRNPPAIRCVEHMQLNSHKMSDAVKNSKLTLRDDIVFSDVAPFRCFDFSEAKFRTFNLLLKIILLG